MITFKGGLYTVENLKALYDVIDDSCAIFCRKYGAKVCKECPNRRPCRDLQNFWKNLNERVEKHLAQQEENPN